MEVDPRAALKVLGGAIKFARQNMDNIREEQRDAARGLSNLAVKEVELDTELNDLLNSYRALMNAFPIPERRRVVTYINCGPRTPGNPLGQDRRVDLTTVSRVNRVKGVHRSFDIPVEKEARTRVPLEVARITLKAPGKWTSAQRLMVAQWLGRCAKELLSAVDDEYPTTGTMKYVRETMDATWRLK